MNKGYSIMVGGISLYSASSEAILLQLFGCLHLGLCFFAVRVLKYFGSVAQNITFFTQKELGNNV